MEGMGRGGEGGGRGEGSLSFSSTVDLAVSRFCSLSSSNYETHDIARSFVAKVLLTHYSRSLRDSPATSSTLRLPLSPRGLPSNPRAISPPLLSSNLSHALDPLNINQQTVRARRPASLSELGASLTKPSSLSLALSHFSLSSAKPNQTSTFYQQHD